MAQQMILVPEMEFQRLKQCGIQQSNEILNDVKRPNETELVKIYRDMENTLNDTSIPAQEKQQKHVEAMNNFTLFRDRVNNRVSEPLTREKTVPRVSVDEDEHDLTSNDTIELFPPTLKKTAGQLLQRLAKHRDIIEWDDKGVVKIRGKTMSGSHIGDLIGGILRTRKTVNPLRGTFLNALAEANIPDEFVRNKDALNEYRNIKIGSRQMMRPPGLPEKLIRMVQAPDKKGRIPKVKRLGKQIKWKNF